jgi:hypothetical protein
MWGNLMTKRGPKTPKQLDREIAETLAMRLGKPDLASLFADPELRDEFGREMHRELQARQVRQVTKQAALARPFTVKYLEGGLRSIHGNYATEAEARARADQLDGWVETRDGRVVYGTAKASTPARSHASKRAHSTIKSDEQWAASVAERRQRDPGAWSSRAQLVSIARAAANNVFLSRKVMTPALIKKAKEAAWKAIRSHDPLAGTSEHPAAAHAHGIAAIAAEGVAQAERRWVPAKEIRSRWAKAGAKLVSHDKRFAIVKEGGGYNLIDLDTYNEYPAASLDEAKSKAHSLEY